VVRISLMQSFSLTVGTQFLCFSGTGIICESRQLCWKRTTQPSTTG
jgi:hypothetical protein